MILRVWVFSALPTKGRDAFIRSIQDLQVTDVALMINSENDRAFEISKAKSRRIEEVCWDLEEIAVSSHLVTWLRPTEAYMTRAAAALRPLCLSTGARSLLFDVEGPWVRNVAGESAARSVLARFWRFQDWPCYLGASGITGLDPQVRPVAELCDYVLPQAYSVAKKSSLYRPGTTQRLAHKSWRDLGKQITMGLAGWKLNRYGGISETASMQRSITATEDLRDPTVFEVAYWSLHWLLGSKIRRSFVRQAAMKARAGLSQRDTLPAAAREGEGFLAA